VGTHRTTTTTTTTTTDPRSGLTLTRTLIDRLLHSGPKRLSDRAAARLALTALNVVESALISAAVTASSEDVPGLVHALTLLTGDPGEETAEIIAEMRAEATSHTTSET
jgi:hypothetical protein